MPVATVVLPTHDHGSLLRLSLRTVQEQTVEDIEIFVIGDGVPDATRELVAEAAEGDPRIRFFDNPKGPRNGEIHRHASLAEARGEIVCYQSDDDLWCPDQVAELRDLLAAADFAHTVSLSVATGGSMTPWLAALESGVLRALMLRGSNFVPLSAAGPRAARRERAIAPDPREGSTPPRAGGVGARDPVADEVARERAPGFHLLLGSVHRRSFKED